MTGITTRLARDFAVQVSSDGVNFVPVLGLVDFNPTIKPTVQSTADYDTDGWDSSEITMQAWSVALKYDSKLNAGAVDPGQELLRVAGSGQFADQARVYVQWYRRSDGSQARQGRALVDWSRSKTATADVEEVSVTLTGDGVLSTLANQPITQAAPTIISASPSGAGAGTIVELVGSGFTGVTASQVKIGGVAATSVSIVSDAVLTFVFAAGTAGSAPITVTNSGGTSASFPYTRAA